MPDLLKVMLPVPLVPELIPELSVPVTPAANTTLPPLPDVDEVSILVERRCVNIAGCSSHQIRNTLRRHCAQVKVTAIVDHIRVACYIEDAYLQIRRVGH